MTFIEWWLGVSPDGGDGSLEALYLAIAAAAAVLWLARRRIARSGRRSADALAGEPPR